MVRREDEAPPAQLPERRFAIRGVLEVVTAQDRGSILARVDLIPHQEAVDRGLFHGHAWK
jgi:hypothetical protein